MTTTTTGSNNICVICLEPLFQVDEDAEDHAMCDVGVAACGHPAHCACFHSWAEFQKAKSRDKGIPCPTCQQDSSVFTKIFLRPETQAKPDLSDDEEEEEEEEEVEVEVSTVNTAEIPDELTARPRSAASKIRRKGADAKAKTVHKKAQYFKKRWMGKVEECKALKLEAKNRMKCHHDDLVDLERSQLLNFRLMKQLEQTIKAASFHRNLVGVVAFGLGWLCSRKFPSP